jgi:hypothetical protein
LVLWTPGLGVRTKVKQFLRHDWRLAPIVCVAMS